MLCYSVSFVIISSLLNLCVPKKYHYPQLYRDHIFRNLTEKGKEIFYPLEIHPSCLKKGGECIPRGTCIQKKMLYISRSCYDRDLVCCYDDTPKHLLTQKLIARMGSNDTSLTITEGVIPSSSDLSLISSLNDSTTISSA